jgi:hypothetical protein
MFIRLHTDWNDRIDEYPLAFSRAVAAAAKQGVI